MKSEWNGGDVLHMFLIGMVIGFMVGGYCAYSGQMRTAAQHGAGIYQANPQTGTVKWKWNDEK